MEKNRRKNSSSDNESDGERGKSVDCNDPGIDTEGTTEGNPETGDRGGELYGDLRTSDSRLRELADTLFDIVYEFDLSGRIVYGNQAAVDAFVPVGAKATDINVRNTMVEKDLAESAKDIQAILGGRKIVAERTFVRTDGTTFTGEVHSGPVYENGKVCGVRGVIRDITERKRANLLLKESEARFRTLFELSPQPVVVSDPDTGRLIDVNERFCALSGYAKDEAIGKTSTELGLFSPEQRASFMELFRNKGDVSALEMDFMDRNGNVCETLLYSRAAEINGSSVILSIVVDVTELRRLERNLNQTAKMEALGQLAGGLAHDFNNLLMAIQGNVSLIASDPAGGEVYQQELHDIEHAIQSGAKLIRRLLGFAAQSSWQTEPADLNELVRRIVRIFARTHKRIRLVEEYGTRSCMGLVDSVQIEQAVLNLLINASQAMNERGDIRVQTRVENLSEETTTSFGVDAGGFVAIEISDSGVGMDKATLERAFEPFFTTKNTGGRGSGLGLASTYGIVRKHGGFVTVESSPGSGSVFTMYLPCRSSRKMGYIKPKDRLLTGDELVLVVDDEPIVLRTAEHMLSRLGYRVLSAKTGLEALQLLEKHQNEISLVLLDMVMSDMDGRQTLAEIRKRNFDVKVLISSGFTFGLSDLGFAEMNWDGILSKPYSLQTLSLEVRRVLGSGQGRRKEETDNDMGDG